MRDKKLIIRNIIIFALVSTLCGWVGYFIDKLAGNAKYENIGTMEGEEPIGMTIRKWRINSTYFY